MSEIVDKLEKLHLFRNATRRDLERLTSLCQVIVFRSGQTIFPQGAEAQNAMILVVGRLEVSIRTSTSHRHLGEIHPGEIFGELAILDGEARSANALAQEKCKLILINREEFLDILHTIRFQTERNNLKRESKK